MAAIPSDDPVDLRIYAVRFLLPFAGMNAIESKDAHSVATIRNPCTNCPVDFDRASYRKEGNRNILETWSRHNYKIEGKRLDYSAPVSV